MFIESLELPIDRAAELPSEGLPLNGLLNDPVIDSLSSGVKFSFSWLVSLTLFVVGFKVPLFVVVGGCKLHPL